MQVVLGDLQRRDDLKELQQWVQDLIHADLPPILLVSLTTLAQVFDYTEDIVKGFHVSQPIREDLGIVLGNQRGNGA